MPTQTLTVRRRALATVAATALLGSLAVGLAPTAEAAGPFTDLLVTETNQVPNTVVVMGRHADGTLEQIQRLATGLNGTGKYVNTSGAVMAQGSNHLLAVNTGSNAVSVFTRTGAALALTSNFFSGGDVPTSIGVHGSRVYVLNTGIPEANPATGNGTRVGPPVVQGFTISDAGIATAIPGARRSMPGACASYPCTKQGLFGQASVSPDGKALMVTDFGHNLVLTMSIAADGSLGPVHSAPSGIPETYGFSWAPDGVATISGTTDATSLGRVTTGRIVNGRWSPIVRVMPTLGAGTCWTVTSADGTRVYAIDAGAASVDMPHPGVTTFRLNRNGTLTPLGFTRVAFYELVFPLDSVMSADQKSLYSISWKHIYTYDIDANGVAKNAPAKRLWLGDAGMGFGATGLADLPL